VKIARTLFLTLVTVSVLLVQSGCWSAVELNERGFARMMLLDKTDKGIEMTLGFPLPNRMGGQQGGGGSEPAFTFVTKTSATLGDAYRQIQSDLPRRITFGQLRNIVIGRPYAEGGLESLVDFVARVPNIHINANLFVTEGRVKQFTEFPVTFEKFPTDILTRYAKDRVTVMTTLKDVLASLYHGGDFIAPMLVFGRQGATDEKSGGKWMSTDGAALMQKGRLVDTLSSIETRGAMWITGDLNDAEFDVASPSDGKNISFLVNLSESRVKSKVHGDQIRIYIICKALAKVILTNSDIDLSNAYQLKRVEQALEKVLEERINMAVEKTRQVRTDAFQLGRSVEWRYPRQWKGIQPEWRRRLATDVKINPQIDIRVKWFGAVRKPEWNRIILNKGGAS
jgi:spore germination protein KC